MVLVLSGYANTVEGFYHLEKDNFDGFPYWKQENGDNAIWFQKSGRRAWTIGHEDYLGQDYDGIIIGPNDITTWPTQISEGFKYWDGSNWQSNDILFEECKYSELGINLLAILSFFSSVSLVKK